MLSCCAFVQADLNIFVSRSWQFYRSKHQRHSLVNNSKSDQTACGMINGKKKMGIMCAYAGLFFTRHAQVYLCLCCCHKCGGQKERIERILLDLDLLRCS